MLPPCPCPGGPSASGPHQTFVNIYEGTELRQQLIYNKDTTEYTYYLGTTQGNLAVMQTFIPSGIHHILIGPDHILFLVGLLLLGKPLELPTGKVAAECLVKQRPVRLQTLTLACTSPCPTARVRAATRGERKLFEQFRYLGKRSCNNSCQCAQLVHAASPGGG